MKRTMHTSRARERRPFVGGFPEHGVWTALGLSRGQFFTILTASVLLFVFVDGPVWAHLRESHFARITVSYAVIPAGVTAALYRNGSTRPLAILAASGVLALLKLVCTAGLLVAIALARS